MVEEKERKKAEEAKIIEQRKKIFKQRSREAAGSWMEGGRISS